MKPTTFEISYETNEGPRRISAGVSAPFETQDLIVSPCVDGSRISCAIETKTARRHVRRGVRGADGLFARART